MTTATWPEKNEAAMETLTWQTPGSQAFTGAPKKMPNVHVANQGGGECFFGPLISKGQGSHHHLQAPQAVARAGGFLRIKALDPAGLFCAEAEVLKKSENETSPLEQHKVEDMQLSRTHPSGIFVPSTTHLQPETALPPAPPPPQRKLGVQSLEDGCINHNRPTNQHLRW